MIDINIVINAIVVGTLSLIMVVVLIAFIVFAVFRWLRKAKSDDETDPN